MKKLPRPDLTAESHSHVDPYKHVIYSLLVLCQIFSNHLACQQVFYRHVCSEAEGDPDVDLGGTKFQGVDRMINQKKQESTTEAAIAVESKYGQVHGSKVLTCLFTYFEKGKRHSFDDRRFCGYDF